MLSFGKFYHRMSNFNENIEIVPGSDPGLFKAQFATTSQTDLEAATMNINNSAQGGAPPSMYSQDSDEPTDIEMLDENKSSLDDDLTCFQSIRTKFSYFFTFDGNNDAKACALIKIPEACAWAASSVYLSAAIVECAYEAAGCISEIPEGMSELPECTNRIYGIKPSSILSLFIMILGIVCAVIMPIIGALLDSSNKRKLVGGLTALAVTALTFAQSFISRSNWFPMLILQLFSFTIMTINNCVALAYLPELTKDTEKLARYNTIIMIFSSVAIIIFLVAMTIVSSIFTTDNSILTARVALLITFCLQVIFYGVSWTKLFGYREANHKALASVSTSDEPQSCLLLRNGLQSLKRTMNLAFRQRSQVRYFLAFKATSQPVYVAFSAATLSYINEHLQVSPRDLGITTLIVLTSAIPGNKFSLTMMQKVNPLVTMRICILLWALLGGVFALFVNRPGQEVRLYLISIFWGFLMGLKDPVDKTILCELIPNGVEAEMSGLYICSSQLFMWVSEEQIFINVFIFKIRMILFNQKSIHYLFLYTRE